MLQRGWESTKLQCERCEPQVELQQLHVMGEIGCMASCRTNPQAAHQDGACRRKYQLFPGAPPFDLFAFEPSAECSSTGCIRMPVQASMQPCMQYIGLEAHPSHYCQERVSDFGQLVIRLVKPTDSPCWILRIVRIHAGCSLVLENVIKMETILRHSNRGVMSGGRQNPPTFSQQFQAGTARGGCDCSDGALVRGQVTRPSDYQGFVARDPAMQRSSAAHRGTLHATLACGISTLQPYWTTQLAGRCL